MVITAGGHRTVPLLYRIPPHRPVFRHGLFASKTSFPLREHISRPLQVRTRFRKIHRSGRKNNVRCPLGTVQKYRIRLSLATAPITLVPFIGHCMADARDMSLTTAVHKAPQGFTPAICGPSDLLGCPPIAPSPLSRETPGVRRCKGTVRPIILNGRYANRPDRPIRREYCPTWIFVPIIAGQFKIIYMKNLSLVQELYSNGFKDIKHPFISLFMKIYAWFSFSMIALAIYVFITTIANGYVSG